MEDELCDVGKKLRDTLIEELKKCQTNREFIRVVDRLTLSNVMMKIVKRKLQGDEDGIPGQ